MQEIKFRGKRTDGCNNWVYGSLVTDGKTAYIISSYKIRENEVLDPIAHTVDIKTVGQYTGRKDNTIWDCLNYAQCQEWLIKGNNKDQWSGHEIYEEHIVKVIEDGEEFIGCVKSFTYDYPAFDIYVPEKRAQSGFRNYCDEYNAFTVDNLEIKIIGNIHENPELLKEEL